MTFSCILYVNSKDPEQPVVATVLKEAKFRENFGSDCWTFPCNIGQLS